VKLNQLEALVAIADGNGIAGAAEKLHITQPAVSKALGNLEDSLGVPLLDRSEYRLKLTDYGHSLLPHARAIMSELEKARLDIKLLKNRGQIFFRYNGSPGTLPKLVPQALHNARQGLPGLPLDIVGEPQGPTEEKLSKLAEGEFDLLIIPIEAGDNTEGFFCEPLIDVELIVISSHNHPARLLNKPTLKELSSYEWLIPSKQGIPDRLVKAAFREAGSPLPDNMIALPVREMLVSFLRNGEYLAFVPYHRALWDEAVEELDVLDLDLPRLGWRLHAIRRKGSEPSAAVTGFVEACKGVIRDSLGKQLNTALPLPRSNAG